MNRITHGSRVTVRPGARIGRGAARMAGTTLLLALLGCSPAGRSEGGAVAASVGKGAAPRDPGFVAYWNQGKAEITRYALEQARYGELRHGDAVMIFVTEDFLGDRQVKLESDPARKSVVPVLKMNLVKKFVTGIYPYSMMTSVFTPVAIGAEPATLKVATSIQEWCGQTWTQLNLRDGSYRLQERSYFEAEGDRDETLGGAMLEDELWTRIRLAPATLPVGRISLIPGTMAARLRHRASAVEEADATLEALGDTLRRYTVRYREGGRSLAIDFRAAFPHRITGWSESYLDGFGASARMLTTRAVSTNSLMIDYWKHNHSQDTALRRALGLMSTDP